MENALIQMENFLLGSWRRRVQDGRRGLSPLDSLGNDGDEDINRVWFGNSTAPHPSQDEPRFELASDMVMVSFLVDEEIRHPFVDHQLGRHEGLPVVMKTRPAEQALAVEAVEVLVRVSTCVIPNDDDFHTEFLGDFFHLGGI